jgi:hypothetical protein
MQRFYIWTRLRSRTGTVERFRCAFQQLVLPLNNLIRVNIEPPPKNID